MLRRCSVGANEFVEEFAFLLLELENFLLDGSHRDEREGRDSGFLPEAVEAVDGANALRGRDYTFAQRIAEVDHFKIDKLVEFSQKLYFNESYCLK